MSRPRRYIVRPEEREGVAVDVRRRVEDASWSATLEGGGEVRLVAVEPDGRLVVSVDGHEHRLDARRLGDGRLELRDADGRVLILSAAAADHLRLASQAPGGTLPLPEALALRAPMTGVVLELLVEVGASVHEGQPLLRLEAMKMEVSVEAPVAGRVEALHVQAQDRVRRAQELVLLRPAAVVSLDRKRREQG